MKVTAEPIVYCVRSMGLASYSATSDQIGARCKAAIDKVPQRFCDRKAARTAPRMLSFLETTECDE